jgi:hypothetical protein
VTDYLVRYDLRRAAAVKPEGIALFRIDTLSDGEAFGTHLGSIDDYKSAERWVNGGKFPDDVKQKFVTVNHPHDR